MFLNPANISRREIYVRGWKRYSLERGLRKVPVADSVLLSWMHRDSEFPQKVAPARSAVLGWSLCGIAVAYCCSHPSSVEKMAISGGEGWSRRRSVVYCLLWRHCPPVPVNHVCLQNWRFRATINFNHFIIKSYLRGITESVIMSSEMIIGSIRRRKIDKEGSDWWCRESRERRSNVCYF